MEFSNAPGRIYRLAADGSLQAELTYHLDQGAMVITKTFVAPAARGQGLAGKLMLAAIALARSHQYQIKPVCSYAQEFFLIRRKNIKIC